MLWMVVYAYKNGRIDTATPQTMLLWERETGLVRERYWDPDTSSLVDTQYIEERSEGPSFPNVLTSEGCAYGTVCSSWLVGGPSLEDRCTTVHSVALMRSPNLAVYPPQSSLDGVWLDVFKDNIVRDAHPGNPDRLYRRHDQMLLSRNDDGSPEVSRWLSVAMMDRDNDGKTPTLTRVSRSLSYTLCSELPREVTEQIEEFKTEADSKPSVLQTP